MNIIKTCIEKPVIATVISLVMILLGLVGYQYLQLRTFPKSSSDEIKIYTGFSGASGKVIEESVTNPIEKALGDVSGIKTMTSTSSQGLSEIDITVQSEANVNEVASEVRDAIAAGQDNLPKDVEASEIDIMSGSDPVMELVVTDPNLNPHQIREYVENQLKSKLLNVNGVSSLRIFGSSEYAMTLYINPAKMAAKHITLDDVKTAVINNNLAEPAGFVKSKTMRFPINITTRLTSAEQFNNIIVKNSAAGPIRFKDIGHAKFAGQDDDAHVRLNGQRGVWIGVIASPNANQVETYLALKQVVKQLHTPKGMKVNAIFAVTSFLLAELNDIYVSIFLAIFCVFIVTLLFVKSLRAVLIPIVTIPICLIATFAAMLLFGFSINIFSLLALVLAVGLVVDDAIVVLENIHRHMELGETGYEAAIAGMKEITKPVIVMTLTLVSVYLPIGFLHGEMADVFREFAFTLASAVVISGVIALTLSPMMCAKILKVKQGNHMHQLENGYARLLSKSLSKSKYMVLVLLFVIAGGFIYKALPQALAPHEDIGAIISHFKLPTGSNIDYTEQYVEKIKQTIKPFLHGGDIFSVAGNNGIQNVGMVNTIFQGNDFNKNDSLALIPKLEKKLATIPGLQISMSTPTFFGNSSDADITLMVTTTGDYSELQKSINKIVTALKSYPGMSNIQQTMKFDSQQYNINVNRELVDNLGISTKAINDEISTLFAASHVTDFDKGGTRYQVKIQAQKSYLYNLKSLQSIYLESRSGLSVSLASLVKVTPVVEQQQLTHYNRLRSAEIDISLAPGYSMNQVINHINATLPDDLSPDESFYYAGNAEKFLSSAGTALSAFAMALIFIYLVLTAQFESFLDPLVILITVPFSVIGAFMCLWLFNGSINLYTEIAMVTLLGLITKHGVLIVQFANELVKQGNEYKAAAIQAAVTRLRPILMTTGAMVLGALPLALSTGYCHISRQQIGLVIISGMLVGTIFSLFIVPAMYVYMHRLKCYFSSCN